MKSAIRVTSERTRNGRTEYAGCRLFGLNRTKELALKLHISSPARIVALSSDVFYRVDLKELDADKFRQIEVPRPGLSFVHDRIFNALKSLPSPAYLHSGLKGRSYITNARMHVGNENIYSIDIRKFYASASREKVFTFFFQELNCVENVADSLSRLCTFDGHIPTGSRISQLLAFYSYRKMFDELHEYALSKDLTFTAYVDDITFSGRSLSGVESSEVRGIIRRAGLRSHSPSRNIPGHSLVVTGAAVSKTRLELPHKHRQKIRSAERLEVTGTSTEQQRQRIQGLYYSAHAVEGVSNKSMWTQRAERLRKFKFSKG